MTPEALERLREAVRVYDADHLDCDPIVDLDDLRALLAERHALRAQVERVREVLEDFDCGHGPNDCPDDCPLVAVENALVGP